MKHKMLIFILFLAFSSISYGKNPPANLIPYPQKIEINKGEFELSDKTCIYCLDKTLDKKIDAFNDELQKGFGITLQKAGKNSTGNFIKLMPVRSMKPETYSLKIDYNTIEISGSESGIFYGLQSLLQLIRLKTPTKFTLPCLEIEDSPKFQWRGMHLDVCRHFFDKEFVKKYIDFLVFYKMNTFHWHLTDDQGWRIQIDKYPKLTEIGGFRNGTLIGHAGDTPEKFDNIKYGGYYTKSDIREIVEYAKVRNVTIVPEIEMPGHCLAALAAYPEYSCTGGPFETEKSWGVFDDVFCAKDETFKFLEDILTEVIELFPWKYIHVGGDKVPKTRWQKCLNCRYTMSKNNLKNENQLQSYFIKRIEKFLNSKGKSLIGWDEILDGGIAPNAAVMSWRGTEGGIAVAKEKHKVVMSSGEFCYFDHYQGNPKNEPLAIGGLTTLEKVFSYNPLPNELDSLEKTYILGAQGNVWTEYIDSPGKVEYMVFPRIAALAEVLWSGNNRGWDDFKDRVINNFTFLDKFKIYYSKTILESSSAHIITNKERLKNIEVMFEKQKNLAKGRQNELFGVFSQNLTKDEELGLKFLFAYMPLSDLADLSGGYFLSNVQISLKAKDEMPWGSKIPEDIYLHFVLPPRINNENLDSFRIKMYSEIAGRVKSLSMKDAALEINHWCHEKVTYKGSDERTISPLSAIKCSYGRCGEESTFFTSALRAAGIPARQVYVARWTHSDDNHAWVEVWVDGKWYFMGACEPDADLNMGWFAVPSTRAMLVHTRAYGSYFGSEPVTNNEEKFSELDLIQNYAPAKRIYAKVIDIHNKPVTGASVEFQIYNYSEMYPIATVSSNSDGIVSFLTGLGNVLVWAHKGEEFGYKHISVAETDTVTIKIKMNNEIMGWQELDFLAPPPGNIASANPVNRETNSMRLKYEDSVRTEYMSTFKDSAWAAEFAINMKIDIKKAVDVITRSRGNWKEITNFLIQLSDQNRNLGLFLLQSISDKDLKDTKASILADHFSYSLKYANNIKDTSFFVAHIMSGRIDNEMITDWRGWLLKELDKPEWKSIRTPDAIIEKCKKSITIDKIGNLHSRAPLTPRGVMELKVCDVRSLNIFFVALCRTLGIPSRINPETHTPQYNDGTKWLNVSLDDTKPVENKKGFIKFVNKTIGFVPHYYTNFSIAAYKDGVYRQIEMDFDKKITDFPEKIETEAGKYIVVTGNRLEDGSVLSAIEFFEVKENQLTDVPVAVRENKPVKKVLGNINLDGFKLSFVKNGKNLNPKLVQAGKSSVLIFIEPDKEPTKHVMADIPRYSDIFDKWGGNIFFLLNKAKTSDNFKTSDFPNLPLNSFFAFDNDNKLYRALEKAMKTNFTEDYPIILIVQPNGDIVYLTTGYRIGTGEQLSRAISLIDK